MPLVGGLSVTTFHTVWNRHPAVTYQPGSSSVAALVSTSARTSFRESTDRKPSSCSTSGSRPNIRTPYHEQRLSQGALAASRHPSPRGERGQDRAVRNARYRLKTSWLSGVKRHSSRADRSSGSASQSCQATSSA